MVIVTPIMEVTSSRASRRTRTWSGRTLAATRIVALRMLAEKTIIIRAYSWIS